MWFNSQYFGRFGFAIGKDVYATAGPDPRKVIKNFGIS
jgi:hypothetical protein